MLDTKVHVCWDIIFNNTGIDWTILQPEIVRHIESQTLHCISDKFYEEVSGRYCVTNDIPIVLYYRVNPKELVIEVVVIKQNNINKNDET